MKTTTSAFLGVATACLLLAACGSTPGPGLRVGTDGLVNRGSEGSVADGIRALLVESARRATADLSRPAGYERRDATRIPMPAATEPMFSMLRVYGYGRLADPVLMDINRGLERTAARAMPVLEEAIARLDIRDTDALMRGRDGVATKLLCEAERENLVRDYATQLKFGLSEAGYYTSLDILVKRYNQIPVLSDIAAPDVEPELRERGVNGICLRMADEEARMRNDPEARPAGAVQQLFARPY